MTKRIHYGFGLEYLPNWGLKEGLREIYQNFIDYGNYDESIEEFDDNVFVTITSDWIPDSLDFLRIGNSKKGSNPNSIGKHGEGLKMAFLIFLREKLQINLYTNKHEAYPVIDGDQEIGPCFAIDYFEHSSPETKFSIQFKCPKDLFYEFHDNIIVKDDIIFSHGSYGDIVNKPKGNIYSGNLFVLNVQNMTGAYNIKPEHLPLDRDRAAPRSFDVNWATSKIVEGYDKWTAKDISFNDTQYVNKIPQRVKEEITPKIIGNTVEFTIKNEKGVDEVIKNSTITEVLKQDNFFQATIKKLKKFIAKQLGLYDLLLEFKEKHVHSADAIADFDLILERVSNSAIKEPVNEEA